MTDLACPPSFPRRADRPAHPASVQFLPAPDVSGQALPRLSDPIPTRRTRFRPGPPLPVPYPTVLPVPGLLRTVLPFSRPIPALPDYSSRAVSGPAGNEPCPASPDYPCPATYGPSRARRAPPGLVRAMPPRARPAVPAS
jgi:hypothetical protein